jgi:hypothetical protein
MVVSSSPTSMSMSGKGTLKVGTSEVPATLTATRLKTYGELLELEAQERLAAEAKEREAREAREALEKLEREARERLESEAAAKQGTTLTLTPPPTQNVGSTVLSMPVPASTTLIAGAGGSLSIELTNPNALAVQGNLTLMLATGKGTAARRRAKKHPLLLGRSTFTVPAGGRVDVKVRLSKAGRSALAHHRTLPVLATVTLQSSATSKTYRLTLRRASPAHRRH